MIPLKYNVIVLSCMCARHWIHYWTILIYSLANAPIPPFIVSFFPSIHYSLESCLCSSVSTSPPPTPQDNQGRLYFCIICFTCPNLGIFYYYLLFTSNRSRKVSIWIQGWRQHRHFLQERRIDVCEVNHNKRSKKTYSNQIEREKNSTDQKQTHILFIAVSLCQYTWLSI